MNVKTPAWPKPSNANVAVNIDEDPGVEVTPQPVLTVQQQQQKDGNKEG